MTCASATLLRSPAALSRVPPSRSRPFNNIPSRRPGRIAAGPPRATLREDLFGTAGPSHPATASKVSIVGAGQVGLACAYSMINQATCRQIVLHDIAPKQEILRAETEDLLHGSEFASQVSVLATCDFADTANSDVVIIPAGARQNEGESRLDLVARNVAIYESIVPQIALHSPDCVILVLSNPVDVMTHVAREISGFPPSRVVGSGTALDTSRFRSLLAQHLDVDSGSVHGMVLGEHGDSSVVVWSQLFVGGVRLRDVHPAIGTDAAEEELRTMHSRVIGAAGEIIRRKGYTNWALGLAVNSIVRCILRDERHILPLSVPARGRYGIEEDVHLSLPAQLGSEGVLDVVRLPLSDDEEDALRQSAKVLADVQSKIVFARG